VDVLTTFCDEGDAERAVAALDGLGIAYRLVSPRPRYRHVGRTALVLSERDKTRFLESAGGDVANAGWVDFRPPRQAVPHEEPPEFAADVFGRMAIVLLAPCIADRARLRLVARFSGDVAEALPYLNAEFRKGSYLPKLPAFTYMDGHRMVSLLRDHAAVAKADDIVDAWATLERVRCLVDDVWTRRAEIAPSFESRRRPPALEIFRRLPASNCKQCGEASCLAFAWAVWRGDADPHLCRPVFAGDRGDLKDALLAVCSGLGGATD
jgi:ArsR family metal-binding transcriptional regulator